MAPKSEGASLSASETALLVNIIRFKTGNIAVMTDWEQVATASGYKNVTNAKTMFSRLCKKLEKSNSDGTESPSGGVSKASTTQGKTKAGPKKAVKRAKAVKEEYDDELDDTGVMEEDDEETEI